MFAGQVRAGGLAQRSQQRGCSGGSLQRGKLAYEPFNNGGTVITVDMKSPGQRRGGRGAGASIPRWRERGHSRICHPSIDGQVDRLPWRVIGPHGNVRQ